VTALVVAAPVLLVAATLAGYAARALLDADQFANRATASVQSSSVRTVIADRVTDRLVLANQPDLLTARPIIASAVSSLVGGDAFGSLLRRAVRDVHRSVFARDEHTVTLALVDVGTVAAAALQQLRPQLAAELERNERIVVLERDVGSVTAGLARLFDRARALVYALAALALAAGTAALAVSRERRRTAGQLGVGIALAGVAVVVALAIARAVVLGRAGDPDVRAAAGAVWDAFLGDLRTLGLALAGAGAVTAAAARSLIRPDAVELPLRRAWAIATTEPATGGLRLARGAGLVAAGVLVIVQPQAALQVAATLVGVGLVYLGVVAILRLTHRPAERGRAPRARLRRTAVPVAVVALIAAGLATVAAGDAVDEPAPAIAACNGHAELCDRRLDRVVLPATHNSMSAPLPGWFAALQERSIGGQLEDGIRGLLLDTHYADRLSNGRTRTHFENAAQLGRAIKQDDLSERSARAAQRLRERLGFRGSGERGIYLCHTFCELGATALSTGLDEIRDFLVTHPTDVVVVVNQDHVSPADFVAAVRDAGLERYAFKGAGHLPTLREMIEEDERLVLLAENQAGAAPWYRLAFERLVQDTPFQFAGPPELTSAAGLDATCAANRGPAGAPLLLVNHWVNTDPAPRPTNAAKVNAYEPLLRRARACRRVRGRVPTLLAVDFYLRGDLFRVVDALNGT
jgi:hypothetical protein